MRDIVPAYGDTGEALICEYGLEFCLAEGKAAFEEMTDDFFVLIAYGFLLAGLGFHSDQADAGFVAGLDGILHFFLLHNAEIVGCHYHVDPIEFCGGLEAGRHVPVSADAKESDEVSLFCTFGPFSEVVGKLGGVANVVHTVVQIDAADVQFLERLVEPFFD